MSVKLFLTQEGNLEINVLEAPGFSIEDEGVNLALPFKTIERGAHHIVIDPLDKLGEVIAYLIEEFKKIKVEVELDNDLRRFWDNYLDEKRKIIDLKRKTRVIIKPVPLRHIYNKNRIALPHQIKGISHALRVENAANFSVPGSGKTQIALGAFLLLKKNNIVEKAIVVGPASCFEPWEIEAGDCLQNHIKIVRWSGTVPIRRKISSTIKDTDLILITYQTACNDYVLLEQLMRRYKFLLILDESHYIKNPLSSRAQSAVRLSPFATRRMILTGTPAPHSLIDIWTQFSFLWPSRQLLGDFQSFKTRIEKQRNPVKRLKEELSPFFVRTTKKDLGLPEIKKRVVKIKDSEIPEEQRKIIQFLELKTLVEARSMNVSQADLNVLRRWRSARIIRLLQAASNPALLLSRIEGCSPKDDIDTSELVKYATVFTQRKKIPAKVNIVLEISKMLIKLKRKVIIWTWFIENIKLLEELLLPYHPLKIYGAIKPYEDENIEQEESREKNIHEFKTRADRPILLANPAACAESISLHKHCQHAIYLDRNFNCGQFLQSMDRIHRVGMPTGLTAEYHIPFINCAIERTVDKRLRKRQEILYGLLSDPMPILGIDEDLWIADSEAELDAAYQDLINEIKNAERV
jgi:SNF2 family DNA or RNA helicase